MNVMTMQEAADYIETADITESRDLGHALIHIGTNAAGARFVLVNDANGQSVVTEAM